MHYIHIPTIFDMLSDKQISILHPQLETFWWAMKQMLYIASYFSETNDVKFFTFLWNKELSRQNNGFSIKNSFSSYPLKFLSFFIIAWQIRKSDYILIWNSPMHFVAVISKILFRSQAILIWWHHHYPWYYEKNAGTLTFFKKIIERLCVQQIDSIVWNSRFLQNELKNIYKREVDILYPRINDIYYVVPKEKDLWEVLNILCIWRWEQEKWSHLISTILKNISFNINIEISIVWEWSDLGRMKDEAKASTKIYFLWFLNEEEVLEQFQKADLLLFPSQNDSFGMVIVESLLSWVPVLAFNKWEAKNIIQDWSNGILCNTEEEFITRFQKLIKDKNLIQKMKPETRKSVVSNYTKDTFYTQIENIIFKK